MKEYTWYKSAFTLIEIIIAITIFGIIMVSVLSIFLFSSQMSTRVDMNRTMQENIKNVTEDISENVRKNWLSGVLADWFIDACNNWSWAWVVGTKLCLNGGIEYTIWYAHGNPIEWKRQNTISECQDITKPNCHIIKRDNPKEEYYPLSNSFSHFTHLGFEITNRDVPKLHMHMSVRPSAKKWLALEIVKNGIIHVQTTLSERLITTQ